MSKTLRFAFALLTGCMTQDSPQDTGPQGTLDPVGVWGLDLTFGAGACGLTTLSSSETVLKGPNGYLLENSPGVTDNGTIECTEVHCTMIVTETSSSNTVTMTLSLNDVDQISGNGKVAEASCSQTFTATGTFAP